jgi:negative regulator of sigma E activity
MNEPADLPEDELVSAVLDDEADDAIRARVATEAALHERLTTFAGLRDDLREVAIPTAMLDTMRLAVLQTTAAAAPLPRTAPAFDLSARRARRTKAAGWISAAAAAVVLIAAIGLAGRGGRGDASNDASMTAAFGTASSGSSESAAQAADSRGNAVGAPPGLATNSRSSGGATDSGAKTSTGATAGPSAPPRDLGPVADLDALISAYRAGTSGAPTTTGSAMGATTGASCRPPIAVAVLGGRPVQLVADGPQVVVSDRSTCVVVGSFTP